MGIAPRAEVAQFAADLLCPSFGCVGKQGEVWIRLAWLVGRRRRGRIVFGHEGRSTKTVVVDSVEGGTNTLNLFLECLVSKLVSRTYNSEWREEQKTREIQVICTHSSTG
jgi:hypothetical protein